MALTQILRQQCPTCGKIAVEKNRSKIGRTLIIRLMCGHIMHASAVQQGTDDVYESIIFSDGAKPRPYQIDAVKFGEAANFRFILADEQGLGKTIEVGSLLRLHKEKMCPAVITVPSTVKLQWLHEIYRICGPKSEWKVQVIQSGKERAVPGFDIYIVTYDMLKNKDLFDMLEEDEIKTVVIDECQKIKNHLSDRAKAVQRVARNVPNIIPMSGTPIKNNAGEYYTVLNLVRPTLFPHYQKFITNYCDSYDNGWATKVGGLKDPERFREDTKDFIIRRTKSEVLKDLPTKSRQFQHVELDRKMNKLYDSLLTELEELLYSDEGSTLAGGAAKIAIMSKMRHITGISKVAECVDFTTEFLLSTDRKIVIFSHHQDVMGMLEQQLNGWLSDGGYAPVCVLHSGLNGDDRAKLVQKFKDTDARVMLASTLAAGEGLNLQFCSDAIMLERQWNPANEEQAEDRFHRFGQMNPVSITYMLASETIDEYFTELVEQKRSIVAATMDNKTIQWDQNSLMSQLAEVLVTKGKKGWKL